MLSHSGHSTSVALKLWLWLGFFKAFILLSFHRIILEVTSRYFVLHVIILSFQLRSAGKQILCPVSFLLLNHKHYKFTLTELLQFFRFFSSIICDLLDDSLMHSWNILTGQLLLRRLILLCFRHLWLIAQAVIHYFR